MNAGIISSRYAKALLKLVQELGTGEAVYSQVKMIVHIMNELPQMKEYLMDSSDVSVEKKISLLEAAVGTPLEPAIDRFLRLAAAHRREEFFPRMLLSFVAQYRKHNGIMVGSLVTATESDDLGKRLEGLFRGKTGSRVHIDEKVDEGIIGGFIFELEGYRVDASVESHLRNIRRQLVEKNNRIV